MSAYYNEIDPFAAAWLRELIAAGLICPGDVDERSIEDVRPADLAGYMQCHFFAGIGIWSLALRQAGWPDDRPIWTGSCPCQPFSAAGKGNGASDDRHLWPVWHELIRACRPQFVVGEQVASSVAVGKQPTPAMLALWREQEYLRVFAHRLQENISNSLQSLSECGGERMAIVAAFISGYESEQIDCWLESEITREGAAFRLGRSVAAIEIGLRAVRGDRRPLRYEQSPWMEHALIGSRQPGAGLHEIEHTPSSVCAERGVRGLGRDAVTPDRINHLEGAAREIGSTLVRNSRKIEREDGFSWLNALQLDLEDADYSLRSVDTCAAGFGAPHIRQRLYFGAKRMADAGCGVLQHQQQLGDNAGSARSAEGEARQLERRGAGDSDRFVVGGLADATPELGNGGGNAGSRRRAQHSDGSTDGGLANADDARSQGRSERRHGAGERLARSSGLECEEPGRPGPTNGLWRNADWLYCRDGKWRPVEPGTFPLADAGTYRNRVAELRGAGNAINLAQAVGFIEAFGEAIDGR